MKIDYEDNFVTLNLDKRTDTVLLNIDEAERCVEAIEQIAEYIQYVPPKIKTISEIWSMQIGLHDSGIALKFNKNTEKVKLPYKIAIQLAQRLRNAIISYKRGYTIQLINKCAK